MCVCRPGICAVSLLINRCRVCCSCARVYLRFNISVQHIPLSRNKTDFTTVYTSCRADCRRSSTLSIRRHVSCSSATYATYVRFFQQLSNVQVIRTMPQKASVSSSRRSRMHSTRLTSVFGIQIFAPCLFFMYNSIIEAHTLHSLNSMRSALCNRSSRAPMTS